MNHFDRPGYYGQTKGDTVTEGSRLVVGKIMSEMKAQDSEEMYDSEGRKIATLGDGAPQQSKNIESVASIGKIEMPIDRLTEVGTEGTTPILDSENIKPEIKIDRLTEVGTEGTERIENPEVLPPLSENGGEKKESAESRAARIAQLESDLANERTEYLRVDFQKNTALSRIRKFFGGMGKYAEDKKRMDDPELAQFRAYYDTKLMQLQEAVLADARERGASDEELARVFARFRSEQKITMASEHDRIRFEADGETVMGRMKQKVSNLVSAYNALPTSKKIAIGLAMVGGGAIAAGTGGAAVGAMASLAAARRIFGGIVSGRGATLALEARGQKIDQKRVDKQQQQILEQIRNMDPQEKYDFLTKRLNTIAIDEENSINRIKNQDINQNIAGAAWGAFVGSGMFGKMLGAGFHDAAEKLKELFGSFGNEVAQSAKEVMQTTPLHMEIQPGGSIEGELIKHLKATVPDMANPGEQAHRIALDYAKAHGIPFDKLNHIYPGTTIDIDPNTHQITGLDAKFMPEVVSDDVDHSNHLPHAAVEPQPNPSTAEMSAPRPESVPEQPEPLPQAQERLLNGSMPEQPVINQDAAFAQETNADLQAERAAVNENLLRAEQRYGDLNEAARVAHEETTNAPAFVSENQFGSNPTMEGFEKEAALRDAMKATHEDVHTLFMEKGILDNPDIATEVKDMRKLLFGEDISLFREARNMSAEEFLKDTQDEILSGPGPDGVDAKVWLGKSSLLKCASVIPPKVNETVAHWTLRVVEEVKNSDFIDQ